MFVLAIKIWQKYLTDVEYVCVFVYWCARGENRQTA